MKKYLFIFILLVVFGAGFYLSYLLFKPQLPQEKVTSQTILESLKSEGFLVTQTYILNQKVTIDKNTGVMWKDFFWGQEITASAVMKISTGVDLTKLTAEDIQLQNNKIGLRLPGIEIQSVELFSDIELTNSQGILKKIFNNDDGYNLALSKLKEEAQKAVLQEKLFTEAKNSTQKEIERLIRLVAPSWQVEVEFAK